MKSAAKTCSAFSLAELMIVVAILGILAAIIIPEFQDHTKQAKEAAAKDTLRIYRLAIERYEIDHGVPPGYQNNNSSNEPFLIYFTAQMVDEYLKELPHNPFNGDNLVLMVKNNDPIPAATGAYGWIYKANGKILKLDYLGVDSKGTAYSDY